MAPLAHQDAYLVPILEQPAYQGRAEVTRGARDPDQPPPPPLASFSGDLVG